MIEGKLKIPAIIEVMETLNHKTLRKIILREGRNRQISKIASLIGRLVQDLQRIAISNIKSNGLQEGKWREQKTKEWIPLIY